MAIRTTAPDQCAGQRQRDWATSFRHRQRNVVEDLALGPTLLIARSALQSLAQALVLIDPLSLVLPHFALCAPKLFPHLLQSSIERGINVLVSPLRRSSWGTHPICMFTEHR